MGGIIRFSEQFFWAMVWVFLLIIIGFMILGWLSNRDGFFGGIADWVSAHARPQ